MPARKLLGLVRPHALTINLAADEDEYIARKSYALGLSKNKFVLDHTLIAGWKDQLPELRKRQRGLRHVYVPRKGASKNGRHPGAK